MQAHYAAGRTVMLIVDEAQYLSQSSLEQLRMLTNPEADSEGALQLVLVGQPQLKQTLNHPDLSQLMQRVVVNMHLGPLGATECRDYIQFRLRVAGTEKPIFTNSALSAIYHGSRGVPRMINMICDMALLYGYAEEMSQIDEAVVAQVIADRGMPGNEVMTPAAGPVPRLESTSIEAVSKQQEDMDREIARQLFKLSVPHR